MHHAAVDELVLVVEAPVLDDDGDFIFAARQTQFGFFLVVDDDAARHAVIHLSGRGFMRMRMVKIEAGAVQYLEFIHPGFPVVDGVIGVPVHLGRYMQPMPVGNAGLGELVVEIDADLLALPQSDDGTEIAVWEVGERLLGTVHQLGRVAIDPRLGPGQYGDIVHLRQKVDFYIRLEVGVGAIGAAGFHRPQPGRGGGGRQQAPARQAHEPAP